MKKKTMIILLMFLFMIGAGLVGLAQDTNAPDPPNDIPIDGGLSLLLAAGLGYGVKKYRDSKQRKHIE